MPYYQESNFEVAIHKYLQTKLQRPNVDYYYYKILIKVANYRIASEQKGIPLTKVEALRAIISEYKLKAKLAKDSNIAKLTKSVNKPYC